MYLLICRYFHTSRQILGIYTRLPTTKQKFLCLNVNPAQTSTVSDHLRIRTASSFGRATNSIPDFTYPTGKL